MSLLQRLRNLYRLSGINLDSVQGMITVSKLKEGLQHLKEEPHMAHIIKIKSSVDEFLEKNP